MVYAPVSKAVLDWVWVRIPGEVLLYKDWSIDNKDLNFIIGVKSTAPEITVSNDLILSQYIKKDNNSKSNHETENN